MNVTVIGTGYLGAIHAVCLAELGNDVMGLDTDPAKIARLAAGEPPFYEPGFAELLRTQIASGRLQFTTSFEAAGRFADTHFLCVGTPQLADSMAADMSHVVDAVDALIPYLTPNALIIGKSTVPVGTAARLQDLLDHAVPGATVAWNPEFLSEGTAIEDTLSPNRIVVGVARPEQEERLRAIYAEPIADGVPFLITDIPTAELVKASANAFLATKVSFINAIAAICEQVGADVGQLAAALGYDERIGARYLRAGIGYGGGCLPKDVRALVARATELGVGADVAFLAEIEAINERRRAHLVDLAIEQCDGSVRGKRIGVLGAAFKPGTDDVRDSPALDIATRLSTAGAEVRIFDPQAAANIARVSPELTIVDSAADVFTDAHLILHLTEWPEFAHLDPVALHRRVARAVLIDGRNILDRSAWTNAAWRYLALGH